MMNAHTDDIQLVQLYRQSISAEHVRQKMKTDKNIENSIYKKKGKRRLISIECNNHY